ncbi:MULTISPECIES: tRNA pseudouridine(38-40) synthase TruA [unclassified Mesorhizobium]|uniref:tRNA pseudouridine(38-40) synthase TruA n=1 Tax=unclassified Mesorhizobium TaxID=325217 RepID=UPI000FE7FBFB|nr:MULTISPECIES: tRNA pseudouridine(38-40) synthase TruA [unclassified Mesorhizobium]MDG4853360.1 tRNA pseudouridine(38-40) synthase TruA [Mesorhizobium sp. WSM4982]MDG4913328.1 tRNA pseudouridine(38-40) synthase TruA [Mesorhizobium sp. WSM4983]RWM97785.1 MAG: tRNA pseudouridine(38-40) synthase TruA [Mesorhizobium sp.]
MPRFRLDIEYDGSQFAGWQHQADQLSVQQAIEQAIEKFCGEEVRIRAAGRTDAGVHATAQVAHVDLARDWAGDKVRDAVNAHLQAAGARIAILKAAVVANDFDARFSATGRHYLYRILNRRAPSALEKGKVWWVPKRLDAEAMHEAAKVLLGRHDFTTFRSTQCQAESPVRTLDRLDVTRAGDLIDVRTSARSFLHNQVRSMVGSLRRVGDGSWSAADLKAALEARNRAACGQVAPPDGLFLVGVDYPATADKPAAAEDAET